MLSAGQSIGSYRIVRQVGTGGMGQVYLAEHAVIGKRVALKVIHRELASNKEVVQRFFQEAKAVTAVGNEHIIAIYDFGQTREGDYFYLMEYLEGQTLAQVLATERTMPAMRALHVAAQIAVALGAAHAAGVIHRDLKPDNVMLTHRLGDPDFVVLLDFGLAKMFAGHGAHAAVKTAAGVLLGTPQYMSPEACESRQTVDHRTDLYALGILLFQMMTGVLPFDGASAGEVLIKQVTQLPPPLRGFNPSIPPSVEQVVLRCLHKNPAQRFPSMQALREALLDPEAYLRASPPIAPARSLAPGEVKVDAQAVIAYAAQQQAAMKQLADAAHAVPASTQAKTIVAGVSTRLPRMPAEALAGQSGALPVQPSMDTMRIATPPGYSSRPPRKVWPIVLVVGLLLGLGGGGFAVAWFDRDTPAGSGDALPAPPAGSGTAAAGPGAPLATPAGPGTAAAGPGAPAPPGGSGTAAAGPGGPPADGPVGAPAPAGEDPAGAAPATGSAGTAAAGAHGGAAASSTSGLSGAVGPSSGTTAPARPVAHALIAIDSTPQGAEIRGPANTSLGRTPAQVRLPIADTPVVLELRLTGYRRKTTQLVVSGNKAVQVVLERVPPARPRPGRRGPGAPGGASESDTALERPD